MLVFFSVQIECNRAVNIILLVCCFLSKCEESEMLDEMCFCAYKMTSATVV